MNTEQPHRLAYKYVPPDRSSYFQDNLLRFTQPGCLNDPFECRPGIGPTVALQLMQLATGEGHGPIAVVTKEHSDRIFVPYLERIADRLNRMIGMLCLSMRWNSSLMWSHYAANHKGFCVGFDIDHDFFKGRPIEHGGWGPIHPVVYSDRRPFVVLEPVAPAQVLTLLTTKHVDWAYEEEMRLLSSLEEAAKNRPSGDDEPISLFRVPQDAVREIYVGARASPALRETLRAHAARLGADFFETSTALARYDLQRWPREALSRAPSIGADPA